MRQYVKLDYCDMIFYRMVVVLWMLESICGGGNTDARCSFDIFETIKLQGQIFIGQKDVFIPSGTPLRIQSSHFLGQFGFARLFLAKAKESSGIFSQGSFGDLIHFGNGGAHFIDGGLHFASFFRHGILTAKGTGKEFGWCGVWTKDNTNRETERMFGEKTSPNSTSKRRRPKLLSPSRKKTTVSFPIMDHQNPQHYIVNPKTYLPPTLVHRKRLPLDEHVRPHHHHFCSNLFFDVRGLLVRPLECLSNHCWRPNF
mmetsp:Transcript_14974/g.30870  ORF Transcript_14974/g.30870 Transcript_14974/m.30870 type:complete len:256 (+) Transcript_14974:184-951(+)